METVKLKVPEGIAAVQHASEKAGLHSCLQEGGM
jgi:hypothetical protein